jgi:predicted nucleotidyltransferase
MPDDRRIEPVQAHQQQVVSVAAASRLGRQIEEIIASLSKVDARFALIGGLALASHKVIRATQDIDLLTDSEKAEDIDRELIAIGYRCLHRSPDAGNYLRGDERVDFIYASRPTARGLLASATSIQTAFGEVRVVSTEGLIGLKIQAFVNNPRRTQDLEDIKALIAANREALKMDEVREYFRLFNRETLLEEILT